MKVKSLSRVRLFMTPWTAAHQAPLPMGFSRQEYWSGLLRPPLGDLPNPGIKSASPALAGGFFTTSATWEAQVFCKWGLWLLSCLHLFSGEGNGNPLQYSCLENPMDGGAWWAAVHGVAKSRTRLSDFTFTYWRRKLQPTPVFLSGESQGQRGLVGCRLWDHTESDTTGAT